MRIRTKRQNSTVLSYDKFESRRLLACVPNNPVDLIIQGTMLDDAITVNLTDQEMHVDINGSSTSYDVSSLNQVVIEGEGGDDTLIINDNSGAVDNTAVLCPTRVLYSGLMDLELFGSDLDHVIVNSGGGHDNAVIEDSPSGDAFNINQNSVYIQGGAGEDAYTQRANGFDEYDIDGKNGSDRAHFLDTDGDDTFVGGPEDARMEFDGGTLVTMSGIEFAKVSFSNGYDLVALNGSDLTDTFVASAFEASLNVNRYQRNYTATGFDRVISKGGLGQDAARISGSGEQTSLYGHPGFASLISPEFDVYLSDYENLNAGGGNGDSDYANVRGSAGDDSFFAGSDRSLFRGPGFQVVMSSFERLNIYADEGNDTASAPNFPGEHTFTGQERRSKIESNVGDIVMLEFERVYAAGGRAESEVDHVLFQDSFGNDQLFATLDSAFLVGVGYQISVQGFWDSTFLAVGPDDRAYLTIPSEMFFEGTPSISSITNSPDPSSRISTVQGFDKVVVNFTGDGPVSDANAVLTGNEGDDGFYARRGFATVTGEIFEGREFSITAKNSSFVRFDGDGGNDVANLVGSELDDVGFLSLHDSHLVGGNEDNRYRIFLENVPQVRMFSGNGGNDSLSINGTRGGNETFFGNSMYSSVRGDGFHLQGVGFESVDSRSLGGDDEAFLVDSKGDDRLVAAGLSASLDGPGFSIHISEYERVVAKSINGGFDSLTLGPIQFELITIGNWN